MRRALRESALVDGPLPLALIAASLAFTLVVLVHVALDRTPDWGLLGFAGLIELGTLVLLVMAALEVGDADIPGAGAITLFGYHLCRSCPTEGQGPCAAAQRSCGRPTRVGTRKGHDT